MSEIQSFKTRIKNKKQSTETWNLSSDFVLLDGEVAFVQDQEYGTRLKVGDGNTQFSALPYFSTAINVALSDYVDKLTNNEIDPQITYVISSDFVDCYGEQVKNVAEATQLSDAVPKWQIEQDYISKEKLSSAISSLNSNSTIADIVNALASILN